MQANTSERQAPPPSAAGGAWDEQQERRDAERYEWRARTALTALRGSQQPDQTPPIREVWCYHEWMPIARQIAAAVREATASHASTVTGLREALKLTEKWMPNLLQCSENDYLELQDDLRTIAAAQEAAGRGDGVQV